MDQEELRMLREMLQERARLIPETFPDHPVVKWFEMMTNGYCPDDRSLRGVIKKCRWYYRFRQGNHTAYLWNENDEWRLSTWHAMRKSHGRTAQKVESIEFALNLLDTPIKDRWWHTFCR